MDAVATPPRRAVRGFRRFTRYSLAGLLALMVLAAGLLALWRGWHEPIRRRVAAREALLAAGAKLETRPSRAWITPWLYPADDLAEVVAVDLTATSRSQFLSEEESDPGRAQRRARENATAALARFPEIERLTLCRVERAALDLDVLVGLPNLAELDLSYTDVTDDDLSIVLVGCELRSLDLQGTFVTDDSADALARESTLRRLTLPDRMTAAGLERLGGLASLDVLTFPDRYLHADEMWELVSRLATTNVRRIVWPPLGMSGIGRWPALPDDPATRGAAGRFLRLTELDLRRSTLRDSDLSWLRTSTDLRWLVVEGLELTPESLVELGRLPSLQGVVVDGGNRPPEAVLVSRTGGTPALPWDWGESLEDLLNRPWPPEAVQPWPTTLAQASRTLEAIGQAREQEPSPWWPLAELESQYYPFLSPTNFELADGLYFDLTRGDDVNALEDIRERDVTVFADEVTPSLAASLASLRRHTLDLYAATIDRPAVERLIEQLPETELRLAAPNRDTDPLFRLVEEALAKRPERWRKVGYGLYRIGIGDDEDGCRIRVASDVVSRHPRQGSRCPIGLSIAAGDRGFDGPVWIPSDVVRAFAETPDVSTVDLSLPAWSPFVGFALAKLPHLEELTLNVLAFTPEELDQIVRTLAACPKLRSLTLQGDLAESLLDRLARLASSRSLRSLTLEGPIRGAERLANLTALPELETVVIHGLQDSPSSLEPHDASFLDQLVRLETFQVENFRLGPEGVRTIARLPRFAHWSGDGAALKAADVEALISCLAARRGTIHLVETRLPVEEGERLRKLGEGAGLAELSLFRDLGLMTGFACFGCFGGF